MTIRQILRNADIPQLEAEIFLASILRQNRTWLISHSDMSISLDDVDMFHSYLLRRKNSEPVAYIIKEKEFYGRSFYVDHRVLIPRPSTETLIDEVKLLFELKFTLDAPRIITADNGIKIFTALFADRLSTIKHSTSHLAIIDVGTGSGCIAITLALELPGIPIIATDISVDALDVAKINADRHGVSDRITFMHCDLLPTRTHTHTLSSHFLVVSNPPYIPEKETLKKDVESYEPHTALYAGENGTEEIHRLTQACIANDLCIGLMLEMKKDQENTVFALL